MKKYNKPVILLNDCVSEGVWATNLSSGDPDAAFYAYPLDSSYGTQKWTGGGQIVYSVEMNVPVEGNRIRILLNTSCNNINLLAVNGTQGFGYMQENTAVLNNVTKVVTFTISISYNGDVSPEIADVHVFKN